MIKLTQIPMCIMDAIRYTGTVTERETTQDVIDWILRDKGYKHGTIEISFFNHALRESIEVRYEGDSLMGRLEPDVLKYSVIDLSAKQWGRSRDFDFEISVMDPESTEYSELHNDNDDWED